VAHEPELLRDPLAQELLQSRRPAHLSYTWTDGGPRTVPIWFHWNGNEVVFGTPANAPKCRALRDGDRVAVSIDSEEFPYRVLLIRGTASVSRVDGIVGEYAQAAERYFGPEQGQAWLSQLPAGLQMVRIAVHPEHVTILDFETRFPSALAG
jgi:PPOX class probable F420-dependent enzyme